MTESDKESNALFEAIDRSFRRAVQEARERSIRMGAPFYVWQDGKIVDLNASQHRAAESAGDYATDHSETQDQH
jgi:hypothetical protein